MRVLNAGSLSVAQIARDVSEVVRGGGVVVMPTDTVYGIFCDPLQPAAVERIYALKGRPRAKPLALYVADVESYFALVDANDAARRLGRGFLPGALTIIVDRPVRIPAAIAAGYATIGIRVPDHGVFRSILGATGELAGTSANLSGLPAFSGGGLPVQFPDADLFVDDGASELGTESTVVDVSQGRAALVRAGVIPVEEIENVLGARLR